MEASIALKPSTARYDIRPDQAPTGNADESREVLKAEDPDEHLLAVVGHQMQVAALAMRTGDAKKGIEVLRRAFRLAEGHSSPPLPAARLAFGLLRLQLCAALSQLGRHGQALEEARAAKVESDEIWQTMTTASVQAAEADEVGDPCRPSNTLRRMIRSPPSWVPRIVEVSIQARQMMALEMEYIAGARGELSNEPATPSAAPREGLPVAKLTMVEEMDECLAEAERLARSLLPEGHETRLLVERVGTAARTRREALSGSRPGSRALRMGHRSSNLAPLPVSASLGPNRPPTLELPDAHIKLKLGNKQKLQADADFYATQLSTTSTNLPGPPGTASSMGGETASTWAAMSVTSSVAPSSNEGVPTVMMANGKVSAPRGDVFAHSMPPPRTPSPRRGGSRPTSQQSLTITKAASTGQLPLALAGRVIEKPVPRVDAFTDWRSTNQDVDRMNYLQVTVRTLAGQKKMQEELHMRTRRFKTLEMKDVDDDTLYEDRTFYMPCGIATIRRAQKMKEVWKTKTWELSARGLAKKKQEDELFAYYNIKMTGAGQPTLKDLKKLYKEAIARSPEERARKQQEEQLRKMQEEEERRRREEERRLDLQSSLAGFAARRSQLQEVARMQEDFFG